MESLLTVGIKFRKAEVEAGEDFADARHAAEGQLRFLASFINIGQPPQGLGLARGGAVGQRIDFGSSCGQDG
jgi:hypothetical protein